MIGHNKPPVTIELNAEQAQWLEQELYSAMETNLKLMHMPGRNRTSIQKFVDTLEMIKSIRTVLCGAPLTEVVDIIPHGGHTDDAWQLKLADGRVIRQGQKPKVYARLG